MKRTTLTVALAAAVLLALPYNSPAPLIYTPGVGWTYEKVGSKEGKWTRTRAKPQLQVAQEAFDAGDYNRCIKAANHTVRQWPLSDFAPEAKFLHARALEEQGKDEKAFKIYNELVENYPKFSKYDEVAERQYAIANKYLDGKWFKLWGKIPLFPSMDKTADMYEQLIDNAPFSEVAPEAQMKIAEAREKQKDYKKAVRALETAGNRYYDNDEVAAESLFKAGLAYQKQAKEAEYDQGAADEAIAKFTDFIAVYPDHEKVDEAKQIIESLKTEQARGAYKIARYYEKKKKWRGALVYYNEVLINDPNSSYADDAKKRIETLKLIVNEIDKVNEEFSGDDDDEK